ncbi:MAG: hypothetical protein JSS38_05195 [Nitrospira sp.]|nr:hypothetical protein [Nitrospira sp.]
MERLSYWEEQLALQRRCHKKTAALRRVTLSRSTQRGLCCAMDFVHDRLVTVGGSGV